MVQEFSSDSSEEATPAKPQLVPATMSKLCSFGLRRLILTGFIRDHLVHHFSRAEGIEDLDLRHLIWQDDPATNILIESVWRWVPQMTERRPAILIHRNSCQNVQKGLDDFAGMDPTGYEEFTTFWVGSHTLFCLGETGAIAEILSTEVQRELTQFGPLIHRTLGLQKWNVREVSKISELEEATENFVVPVTVGWAYTENWRLVPEALPLRRISLSFLLDLDVQRDTDRPAAGPTDVAPFNERSGPIIQKPARSAPKDPC